MIPVAFESLALSGALSLDCFVPFSASKDVDSFGLALSLLRAVSFSVAWLLLDFLMGWKVFDVGGFRHLAQGFAILIVTIHR